MFAGVDQLHINVPRETTIDGEARESVQMGPAHLLEDEQLSTAQPSEDNNTSSCQPITSAGELGPDTDVSQYQNEGELPRPVNPTLERP